MIYDWPFTPFIITKIIRVRKIEKCTGGINENAHNHPECVWWINENGFRLTDLLEKVEHAEYNEQDILHGNGRRINGRFLRSHEFKESVSQKEGRYDQNQFAEQPFREIEVDKGGKKQVFDHGEKAEKDQDQVIVSFVPFGIQPGDGTVINKGVAAIK